MTRVLIALACLMGAAGVLLAAAAAHSAATLGAAAGASLGTAANILLFHAPAVIAAAIAAHLGLMRRHLAPAGMAALLAGAVLFAGDIVVRVYAGHRLFPMAAPSGGTLIILGWLALGTAALSQRRA